jgi:DNA-binding NarL/FixJ family response regulator
VAIRVLIADDHRLVREALCLAIAIEGDIDVVGDFGDACTAFEHARRLKPDVIVLDVGLRDLNGIRSGGRLQEMTGVEAKIVALSDHVDRPCFVAEILRAGATGYVTKMAAGVELIRAIRAVVAGQGYLCPVATNSLVTQMRDDAAKSDVRLSRRERDVLRLIAEGVRSPAIAHQLHIALGTVEVHRRNIMRKLEMRTIAELTRYAIRNGLVTF